MGEVLESCAGRVAKGVEVLDAYLSNWRDKINLDDLSMGSTKDCIVAQIGAYFGNNYDEQLERISGITEGTGFDGAGPFYSHYRALCDWAAAHGFHHSDDEAFDDSCGVDSTDEYRVLGIEWRKAIAG